MKIAVLISGGVDSAVVVHKLFEEGHELHLFYIRIGMDDDEGDCNAEEDIEMCTLIAKKYNLPLEIINLHEEYWEYVMTYALDSVSKGFTPNPDIMCNKIIKFGFFEELKGKEFDKTATGHYANIIFEDGKYFLASAKDPVKDQTDFLAGISYQQLSHLMFPLGDLTKKEVREIAEKAALPNSSRKDSQGICFLGKIDYNKFIARKLGEREGPIINIENGQKIGIHRGFWFYTIGQRKGLGLSGGPWFVVKKNIRDNVVFVSKDEFYHNKKPKKIFLEKPHWISINLIDEKEESGKIDISFKIRHSPEFFEGTLLKNKEGDYCIIPVKPVKGTAPGQFAVIYDTEKKKCFGSAVISQALTKKSQNQKSIKQNF